MRALALFVLVCTLADNQLPGLQSINLWGYLSGAETKSPRTFIPIGSTTCEGGFTEGCINRPRLLPFR